MFFFSLIQSLFLFLTFSSSSSSLSPTFAQKQQTVISYVLNTDCVGKFDYTGELSASLSVDECEHGGAKSTWYVVPACRENCDRIRMRPFARVELTCATSLQRMECLA